MKTFRYLILFVLLFPVSLLAERPNVILIISDDHAWTDYGFLGNEKIRSPHIDQLAAEGLTFTRGYVTTALCSPSLATMLTGLYTHHHGITSNDPVKGKDRDVWLDRFFENPMLPKLLADAGYNTMHTGKYWMRQPAAAGFTHDNGETGRHGGKSLDIGRKTMKPIYDFMDQSIENKKPFFVWYAPFLPHTPHNPPKRLLDKYADVQPAKKAKYYAMVEWLDETCGDLMKNLKDKGVDDNTLVLYLADNGWNLFGKASPYENGIRTPIIVRWPARIKAHKEEVKLASNIDLVPTILTACGVDVPAGMPGINLLDDKAVADRTAIFFNNFSHNMISAHEPGKSLWTRSVIQGKWKLITYQDPLPKERPNAGGHNRKYPGQNQELFDLLADPHETKDLSKEHAARVAELQARMDDWWDPNGAGPAFAEEGFESLFNGKDLSGWDGRKGLWTVEDGAIVGSTQVKLERNTFLIWKGGDVGDFVLKLKMKFAGGNSGIQYRAKVDDDAKHYVSGNQCDIHPRAENYGMLYSEKTGLGIIAKGGQKVEVSKDGKKTVVGETEGPTKADTAAWNEIEIHAEGNRVIHKVNGKVTVDVTSLHETNTRKGVLAIQLHVSNKPMKVWVKDVRLKKLGAAASAGAKPKVLTVPPDNIRVPEGFKVELVYTVPRETQGSWASMCSSPDGSLFVSDEKEKGLYRVWPSKIGEGQKGTRVSKVPADISNALGMCVAFESLYVMRMGAGNGLWRVADSDGDGRYDKPEQLFELVGAGGHGPHAVLPDLDGKHLLICGGNGVGVPPGITHHRVPPNWAEDLLLPRQPDGRGHARGRLAPGGWVARISPDAKTRSLISIGYRNEYDIAQNRAGDIFTFDADMEFDFGLPWYRPTRINFSASGADHGWRHGSGKWPAYYPDSVPAVVDIGPASPTGVIFGYNAKFPTKYRDAFLVLDWTYGTIWAAHLSPKGAGYSAKIEQFAAADALPVTDTAIGTDGAMYFVIGGRQIQSALYRIAYVGDEPTDSPVPEVVLSDLHKLRRSLEVFHGVKHGEAVKTAWQYLDHEDRWIRHAARIAVESQPVDAWRSRALSPANDRMRIHAAVALARQGVPSDREGLIASLASIDVAKLPDEQKLEYLRAVSLVYARLSVDAEGKGPGPENGASGRPTAVERKMLLARIDPLFPSTDRLVNRELARVLVYLEAPKLVGRVLDHIAKLPKQPLPDWATTLSRNSQYGGRASSMLADMPPTEGMHFAFVLRNLKTGWTLKQREVYFAYLIEASKKPGGASYADYLLNIREEALANCTPAEKIALTSLSSIDLNRKPEFKITPPKGPGQAWTVKSAVAAVNKVKLRKRNFKNGQNLFFATACAACHRLGGFGGAIGPDLTSAGGKLDLKNLLEAIIDPSKAISDQFGSSMVARKTDPTLMGLVVDNDPNNAAGTLLVFTHDPKAKPVKVAKADVKSVTASPVSQMPPGLINTLNEKELADLVAYLLSGGNKRHRVYK